MAIEAKAEAIKFIDNTREGAAKTRAIQLADDSATAVAIEAAILRQINLNATVKKTYSGFSLAGSGVILGVQAQGSNDIDLLAGGDDLDVGALREEIAAGATIHYAIHPKAEIENIRASGVFRPSPIVTAAATALAAPSPAKTEVKGIAPIAPVSTIAVSTPTPVITPVTTSPTVAKPLPVAAAPKTPVTASASTTSISASPSQPVAAKVEVKGTAVVASVPVPTAVPMPTPVTTSLAVAKPSPVAVAPRTPVTTSTTSVSTSPNQPVAKKSSSIFDIFKSNAAPKVELKGSPEEFSITTRLAKRIVSVPIKLAVMDQYKMVSEFQRDFLVHTLQQRDASEDFPDRTAQNSEFYLYIDNDANPVAKDTPTAEFLKRVQKAAGRVRFEITPKKEATLVTTAASVPALAVVPSSAPAAALSSVQSDAGFLATGETKAKVLVVIHTATENNLSINLPLPIGIQTVGELTKWKQDAFQSFPRALEEVPALSKHMMVFSYEGPAGEIKQLSDQTPIADFLGMADKGLKFSFDFDNKRLYKKPFSAASIFADFLKLLGVGGTSNQEVARAAGLKNIVPPVSKQEVGRVVEGKAKEAPRRVIKLYTSQGEVDLPAIGGTVTVDQLPGVISTFVKAGIYGDKIPELQDGERFELTCEKVGSAAQQLQATDTVERIAGLMLDGYKIRLSVISPAATATMAPPPMLSERSITAAAAQTVGSTGVTPSSTPATVVSAPVTTAVVIPAKVAATTVAVTTPSIAATAPVPVGQTTRGRGGAAPVLATQPTAQTAGSSDVTPSSVPAVASLPVTPAAVAPAKVTTPTTAAVTSMSAVPLAGAKEPAVGSAVAPQAAPVESSPAPTTAVSPAATASVPQAVAKAAASAPVTESKAVIGQNDSAATFEPSADTTERKRLLEATKGLIEDTVEEKAWFKSGDLPGTALADRVQTLVQNIQKDWGNMEGKVPDDLAFLADTVRTIVVEPSPYLAGLLAAIKAKPAKSCILRKTPIIVATAIFARLKEQFPVEAGKGKWFIHPQIHAVVNKFCAAKGIAVPASVVIAASAATAKAAGSMLTTNTKAVVAQLAASTSAETAPAKTASSVPAAAKVAPGKIVAISGAMAGLMMRTPGSAPTKAAAKTDASSVTSAPNAR
jgi:hypothetical protein